MARVIQFPDAPEWQQSVSLDGRTYTLRARYNVVSEQWSMDILTRNKSLLVGGIRLVRGVRLMSQFNDDRLPPGDFAVIGEGKNGGLGCFCFREGRAQLLYLEAGE